MLKDIYDTIREEGGAISVVYTSESTLDPVTEEETVGSSTTFSTYGVKESYSIGDIDGVNIKVGDIKMLIPHYGFTFDFETLFKKCVISSGSKNWNVVSIDPLKPGDDVYMYTAQLRG